MRSDILNAIVLIERRQYLARVSKQVSEALDALNALDLRAFTGSHDMDVLELAERKRDKWALTINGIRQEIDAAANRVRHEVWALEKQAREAGA